MTINGLMAQRSGFVYTLPMSHPKEKYVTQKQSEEAGTVGQSDAARSAAATQVPGRLEQKKTTDVTEARVQAATQSIAATESSLNAFRMQNQSQPAATFSHTNRVDSSSIRTPAQQKALVEQMRADTQQRMSSLQNLTSKIFSTQVNGYSAARNFEVWDQEWKGFMSGYSIDTDTQEDAQKAISDDGYWGVQQTSDRIMKYATALAGGDEKKLNSMLDAFEQGYQAAEKAWGGELPDIAQQTREAVLNQFQDLKTQNATAAHGLAAAS